LRANDFAEGIRLFIEHFTLHDVVGCTAGVMAFCPFLLGPGYFAGFTLNLFQFRRASWRERILLSVVLAVAVTPILATLIGRLVSLLAASWLFVLLTIAAGVLGYRGWRGERRDCRLPLASKIAVGLFAAWTLLAIGSLVDVQIGDKLYLPAAAFDQCLRSAFAAAASRTGVPPANPFFYPGHPVTMRYYYYWNVVCALPVRIFGLNARHAELASVVWAGFALAALVPVYLKHFCNETVDLGRKSVIGIALLSVTGLDLIPTIVHFVTDQSFYPDMEWWDGVQVTSWADSMLWVPHHVGALVACLVGLVVLWSVAPDARFSERAKAALIAALAFASAAGLSVYITFTFAIFLITWTIALLRSKAYREVLTFAAVGALTIVVSLGYLHDLRQPGYTGSFATFYVRALESMDDWADAHIDHEWLQDLFLVAVLPVYYTIELGFFALVGFAQSWAFWRRAEPLKRWEWATINMLGSSLLVGSFLMSTTGNNDLGYRSVLLAQFVLLLWAVPLVYRWKFEPGTRSGSFRLLFHAFLWIGLLGSVYQLLELRSFNYFLDEQEYVEDAPWLPKGETIAEDLYRARAGFEVLNQHLPEETMVQYSPVNPAYVPNAYYSLHPAVDGFASCGTPFGGDPFLCLSYQNKILEAFNGRKKFTVDDADRLCSELGIDVLVAERADRMWALKQSWVWKGSPLVENPYMRAVACGAKKAAIEQRFGIIPER
jgi:hypothetical protein